MPPPGLNGKKYRNRKQITYVAQVQNNLNPEGSLAQKLWRFLRTRKIGCTAKKFSALASSLLCRGGVKGCSHMISAENGGVQTPLPSCQPKSEIDLPPSKASFDRCGQQHRYHSRVDLEYPQTRFYLKKGKNHPKRENSKMSRNMPKLAIRPQPEVSNPSGSMVSTMFCWTKNTAKPNLFEKRKNHPKRKNSKMSSNMPK